MFVADFTIGVITCLAVLALAGYIGVKSGHLIIKNTSDRKPEGSR